MLLLLGAMVAVCIKKKRARLSPTAGITVGDARPELQHAISSAPRLSEVEQHAAHAKAAVELSSLTSGGLSTPDPDASASGGGGSAAASVSAGARIDAKIARGEVKMKTAAELLAAWELPPEAVTLGQKVADGGQAHLHIYVYMCIYVHVHVHVWPTAGRRTRVCVCIRLCVYVHVYVWPTAGRRRCTRASWVGWA